MKAILLCLVVASVFAKPKGYIELADAAKDVAQKETDKAVEEARHANVRQKDCRSDCVQSVDHQTLMNDLDFHQSASLLRKCWDRWCR